MKLIERMAQAYTAFWWDSLLDDDLPADPIECERTWFANAKYNVQRSQHRGAPTFSIPQAAFPAGRTYEPGSFLDALAKLRDNNDDN